jgi:PKD repeat protein
MSHRPALRRFPTLLVATLVAVACSDAVSPKALGPSYKKKGPITAAAAAGGIALDQFNGTMGTVTGGTMLIQKGFNPVNPHNGDAIVVTFFWSSANASNLITDVRDYLTNGTSVGNTYTLVEYASSGGISMATYVATNVQHFPDAYDERVSGGDSVLVIGADLSAPVTRAGEMMTAYTGVQLTLTDALGAHRSAAGSASSVTPASAGSIAAGAGALVHAVTMATPVVGDDRPAGFTNITTISNDSLKADGEYAVQAAADTVNAQWNWYFSTTYPGSWVVSALVLNPQGSTTTSPGNLTVTTSTTGSNLDPDGYSATVDGASQPIGVNGSVTFTGLAGGDHSVTLSGVAANCTVSGANPRTVTVPSGGTASTTFAVSCAAAGGGGGSAEISGTGSLGTGTATPGSSRQDFDFDVTASLGGHISYTDWSVVRADGSAATLTVSPTDTATHLTAFRTSSSICADASRGAEFDGIGRVNSGGDSNPSGDELLAFTVQACDNGAAGSGDLFAIQVPGHGYAVGPDGLTSGDVVKSSGGSTGTATRLAFTTQPSNVAAGGTISPAVRVTAQDSAGNTATSFSGAISVAIGSNPGGGTLSGTTSVAAVNGVATFSNLSINNPGTGYTLTAAASGLSGATSAAFNVTASNQPPTANFTFNCSGLSCSFTSTGSDPDGSIASYSWTFGDGGSSTAQNPSHSYSASGSYTVTLTVTDNQGASSAPTSKTVSVAASNQPPTANFTFNCSSLSCSFTSTSSDPDGSIASYSWTFGDGGSSTAQNPSHSYSAGGSYTVTLRVTDNQGATSSPTSKTVSVTAPNQPPTANFTFTCSSLSCSFTSTSGDPDGSIASYSWTFGDGGSSTAQNPSHTFAAGGSYTVTLRVTDNQGATSSPTSRTVTVTAPNQTPAVNAGPDETALTGLLYSMNWSFSDPDNGPWSYTINWGDGTTTSGSKSSAGSFTNGHTYVTVLPRNFTVTVTVTDSQGASGSDSKVVSVLLL